MEMQQTDVQNFNMMRAIYYSRIPKICSEINFFNSFADERYERLIKALKTFKNDELEKYMEFSKFLFDCSYFFDDYEQIRENQ